MKYVLTFLSFLTATTCFVVMAADFCSNPGKDLLEQGFCQAKTMDTVINLGNNKQAVGNQVLQGGVNVSLGGGPVFSSTDPLIVRITKFLLRMTLVLGVTMMIYSGVQYMIGSSSGEETKQRKFLGYIAIGIILALMSVSIIYLIDSITNSTFQF